MRNERQTSDTIGRVIGGYVPRDDGERADVARLRGLLDRDIVSRTTPVHVTGSALVVHPPTCTVLLRWHPRMEMWMQVGGHFDAGEDDPWLVALREAREETGLTDLRAFDDADADAGRPVQIVIVPVPAHGDEPEHEHADFRYVLVTDTPDSIVPESTAARLRWTDLAAAVSEASEDNLRVFLTRVAELVGAR